MATLTEIHAGAPTASTGAGLGDVEGVGQAVGEPEVAGDGRAMGDPAHAVRTSATPSHAHRL